MNGLPPAMLAPILLQPVATGMESVASNMLVMNLLPIALATSAIIIALYYMLGKALSSPQVDAFAKEELSQWVISVLIAVSWFAIYGIVSGIASAAACGSLDCDLFSLAFYSLDHLFYKIMSAYLGFLSMELFIGVISSIGFSVPLGTPVMGFKWMHFSPFTGMGMLSNAVVSIIESIGMLVGLVVARQQILTFFKDIVPAFILPLGIFLRSLPFTRVTGSSLIAIAFAAYFIFPSSIILSHYMMFGEVAHPTYIPMAPTPTGLCVPPETAEGQQDAAEYLAESNLEIREAIAEDLGASVAYENEWYHFSGFVGSAGDMLLETFSEMGDFVSTKFSYYSILDILKPTTFAYFFYFLVLERLEGFGQIAVMTAVTFVLEIIITITGYRALAAALGGELEILGLTKVV